jgi:hypothetical protein
MGILIGAYLLSRGILTPWSFNVAIIAVVSLTITSPVLMKVAFSGFEIQPSFAQVTGSGRSGSSRQNP